MPTTDIQADKNQFYRLLKQFHDESKAVTISGLALIVAVLGLLMAWMAVDDATEARAEVRMQNQRIDELTLRIETQDAKLYALQQKE